MPPDIARLPLWQVERALASLSDGEIAWTVTQATYHERFSPMAVAEVCCLYWLFLLRGYIASQLGRSARATPWMTPYSTRSQLASARRPRRGNASDTRRPE